MALFGLKLVSGADHAKRVEALMEASKRPAFAQEPSAPARISPVLRTYADDLRGTALANELPLKVIERIETAYRETCATIGEALCPISREEVIYLRVGANKRHGLPTHEYE